MLMLQLREEACLARGRDHCDGVLAGGRLRQLTALAMAAEVHQQELPVGWTMGFDESCGSYYYFNAQTGQSQWEAPHFVAQQEPAEQPVFKVATATQQGVVCTMKSASGWGPRFCGKYTLKNGDEEGAPKHLPPS